MICPRCNSELKQDDSGFRCIKYHYFVSTEQIEAEKQAQESLNQYLDTIKDFTTQVGQGYANFINWNDADNETVQNMGTRTGKVFAGFGKVLPHITTCPDCAETSNSVAIRRLNTAYCNDIENWMVSCEECFDRTVDMYDEMWQDYYSSVM